MLYVCMLLLVISGSAVCHSCLQMLLLLVVVLSMQCAFGVSLTVNDTGEGYLADGDDMRSSPTSPTGDDRLSGMLSPSDHLDGRNADTRILPFLLSYLV